MAELISLITNNRIATYSTQKSAEAKGARTETVKPDVIDTSSSEVRDRANEMIDNIKEAVRRGNDTGIMANSKLSYSVDDRTNTIVVQVVDKESGEVIRQIPPDEFLNIAARFEEEKGAIVNEKG